MKRDLAAWSAWLRGEVDPTTGTSWATWHRKQLSRVRNDRGNQTSHWGNVGWALITQCAPLALLALVRGGGEGRESSEGEGEVGGGARGC